MFPTTCDVSVYDFHFAFISAPLCVTLFREVFAVIVRNCSNVFLTCRENEMIYLPIKEKKIPR